MRRSILWIPVLLLGAVLYWSVALGLGGLSLAMLSAPREPMPEVEPPRGEDAIVVRLASPEERAAVMPIIRGENVDPRMIRRSVAPPPRDAVGRTAY